MKSHFFILGLLFFLNGNAQVVEKILTPSFDFINGTWEGSGWMMTDKGKINATITEKVQCKLDCSAYLVEGMGTKMDSATNKMIVVHDALGVIVYDKTKAKWVLKAFKKEGTTESDIEFLGEKKFRWSMDIPGRGTIRYTTDLSSGKWVEIGEFSRDNGKTWMPVMSMTLEKAVGESGS